MKIEDALRKIRLLRRIIPENGALVSRPKPRLAWSKPSWSDILFGKEDVHLVATPRSRMTWVYWEQMLADFGIALVALVRALAPRLGNDSLIIIRLAAGHWHVQQSSSAGWKITVRDSGLSLCECTWPNTLHDLTPWWGRNGESCCTV
jgi:hypothetical protein